jgi:hypothetical protein
MNPPNFVTLILYGSCPSYTHVLWKSYVSAPFYADIFMLSAPKHSKIALFRPSGFKMARQNKAEAACRRVPESSGVP